MKPPAILYTRAFAELQASLWACFLSMGSGVTPDKLNRFDRLYAERERLLVSVGLGIETRHRNETKKFDNKA